MTTHTPEKPQLPAAEDLLQELLGRELLTLTGARNRIVELRPHTAVVATSRSPSGQPVPTEWVQRGLDRLAANGEIAINVESLGYRSAFIGAVLRELPMAHVDGIRIRILHDRPTRASLEVGKVYGWDAIALRFGFKPEYLSIAGGMPVSKEADAVLLITHPGGAKSFDYEDFWDGRDLIYTGRGKFGDQARTAANLDVAENRRRLFAFEAAGPRQLRYLGQPKCVDEGVGRAPDATGEMRNVFQFRLRFAEHEGRWVAGESRPGRQTAPADRPRHRTPRAFDPTAPAAPSVAKRMAEPEDVEVKQEKAAKGHAKILRSLASLLEASGWTEIEEIPAAVDLWAIDPSGKRVLFEAKTITSNNEVSQCRGGLAQLLEYRLEYADAGDELALVFDAAISLRRARFLEELGVAALVVGEDQPRAMNSRASRLARALTG